MNENWRNASAKQENEEMREKKPSKKIECGIALFFDFRHWQRRDAKSIHWIRRRPTAFSQRYHFEESFATATKKKLNFDQRRKHYFFLLSILCNVSKDDQKVNDATVYTIFTDDQIIFLRLMMTKIWNAQKWKRKKPQKTPTSKAHSTTERSSK